MKKWLKIGAVVLSAILIAVLVMVLFPQGIRIITEGSVFIDVGRAYAAGEEIIESRTEHGKTYYLGNNRYSLDVSVGMVHYKDALGNWQNINNEIISGEMTEAPYHFRLLQNTFDAGRIVEFSVGSFAIQLQPMALEWSNDLDQISPIAIPQPIEANISNTLVQLLPDVDSYQGSIKWINAYGSGRDFEWILLPSRLAKILTIPSLANLPTPPQYIIDGGNPFLRLNMIFDPSADLEIYVDDTLWTRQANSQMQTFGRIEFRNENGDTIWDFAPLLYWDSSGNGGESVKTVRRTGSSLYVEVRVPYEWLRVAIYPVGIDATIDVDVTATNDDGYVVASSISYNEVFMLVGNSFAVYDTWYRFDGITIPQSSTVDVAYIQCYEWSSASAAKTNIYADDQNDPDYPASAADYGSRTETTNFVAWDGDPGAEGYQQSDSLVDIIQELVNSYDYDNEAIQILHEDDGSSNGEYQYFYTYDNSPSRPPKIHIEYSGGASPDISNTPATVDFGTLYVNTTYYSNGSAPTFPLDDGECYFTVTNNSGANATITISSTNFTGGNGWVIDSSIGEDIVVLKAGKSGDVEVDLITLTGDEQTFISSIADSASMKWELRLETGTYTDGDEKSANVTLTASLP